AQNLGVRKLLLNEYVSPEELVSMSKTLPFDKAISIFSDFSQKYMNKIIVDPKNRKSEIGVDIENMYWIQALETVLRANNLWYIEREEYFQIYSPEDSSQTQQAAAKQGVSSSDTTGIKLLHSRDVKISSVFFSVDVVKSLNAGINWDLMFSRDSTQLGQQATVLRGAFNSGVTDLTQQQGQTTTGTQSQPGFALKVVPSINFTNLSALISFFQDNQLGDVISSPQVTVTSGKKGTIQVGQNFYITTKDFAGNTIQQEQKTGIIIDVTPTVYEMKGIKFINLDIHAERSSFSPGPIINTSSVNTNTVLMDGEETVIGGLYTTVESHERAGIPLLKDLPWWFFGLRYLFGYDKITDTKQELIILLKPEVVPTLEERFAQKEKVSEDVLKKTLKEFDSEIERRKIQR
ncbi:MAG: type II and III secretion system protein, partial [Bacteroidota bacterium]|nr:type II and III secretion system protein [Bacteroidota bacterium]